MKRKVLLKELRKIADTRGEEMTIEEGAKHTKILFDGRWVTTVGRHSELPERTANKALDQARNGRRD